MGNLYYDNEYYWAGEISFYYVVGPGLAIKFTSYASDNEVVRTLYYNDTGFFGSEVEMT